MPAFGKRVKEESINDKMVRLFKEGRSVTDISRELDVKPDVITNVIRRRCGEDSIPETVIRSKNAIPHPSETVLKADTPEVNVQSGAPVEEPAAEEEAPVEGMSKLERMMMEKDKKRQEAEAAAAEEAAAEAEAQAAETEEVSMDGISTDDLDLGYDYSTPVQETEPAAEEEPAADESLMEGISAYDIPAYESEPETTEPEASPYASFAEAAAEETASEEEAPAVETPSYEEKISAPVFDIHSNGSAFDKMKAFAQSQIAMNNDEIAKLEAQLGSSETDYAEELQQAESVVEQSKVTYEEVLERGEEVSRKRMELQTEHRAALARAEEDYRKKLAELDEEYNNATARANKEYSEKEVDINAESDAIDEQKELAKNNFLTSQAAVNDIKKKIADEVDAVKAKIQSLKDENAGYENFMG